MERYTIFLDWKNQYCENEYITQSNLQIQCNPYRTTNGILHRIRCNFFFCFFFFKVILFVCLFIYLFIYLWLCWVMAVLGLRFCARAFSRCGKWGPLFIAVRGPFIIAASLVAEHRLQTRRLSSCGSRA